MTKEEKYSLLEKIIDCIDYPSYPDGKKGSDYPGFNKVKKFLIEKRDELSDKIILLGDVLSSVLSSAIMKAKAEEDLTIELTNGELKISYITKDIEKGTGTQDEVHTVAFSTEPNYPAHRADVQIKKKKLYIQKSKSNDESWEESIHCISEWYDTKTGIPVAIGYNYGIQQEETKKLDYIREEFISDKSFNPAFQKVDRALKDHMPYTGLIIHDGIYGNGQLVHTECPWIHVREDEKSISLIAIDESEPLVKFAKPLTDLQGKEIERLKIAKEQEYAEGKLVPDLEKMDKFYGYYAIRIGLADLRKEQLTNGKNVKLS